VPPSGYIIQEALSFVRRHFAEGIGVDDVVKHLGVSHSLVRERFRTVYGKSLRDVILDMRIKAAMSLLSRTKASVREIALKVGFSSDAHFVRYFRKKTGTTPAAYRSSRVA
jgi:AraC-like DNA-binding protein